MKYIVTLNGKNYEVSVEKGEAILENITDAPVMVLPLPPPLRLLPLPLRWQPPPAPGWTRPCPAA